MESEKSSTLIRRARAGSSEAVEQLLEAHGARLLALIRLRLGRRLRREMESRDVLQNTFLKAFEKVDQFEGAGRESFMAWMAAIACNEIRENGKYYRRLRRDADLRTSIHSGFDAPALQVHSAVSRIALDRKRLALEEAMEQLTPEHREVILLRSYEELEFKAIGERMERSPDAVRMLYARGMTALSVSMRRGKRPD